MLRLIIALLLVSASAHALALNNLPARYTQPGSIVLRDPVRAEHIQAAIREAVETALGRPKV